jgi:hypothetical protein
MNRKRTHVPLNLILFFSLSTIYCLIPSTSDAIITFQRVYGGTDWEVSWSVQQTQDEGYIIGGSTESFGADSGDVYLIKTDSLGDTLWTRMYGGASVEYGYSVQMTSDGGYIITGYTTSYGAGAEDAYLVKTDSLGDTLWTRTYGDTMNDYGLAVQQTSDGGYIITGSTGSFGSGGVDLYLIKTNSSGDTLWTRIYGGPDDDWGRSVKETPDGGYIISGTFGRFSSTWGDVYLIKTDSLGDTLWTRTFGGADEEGGNAVVLTSDGGYVIAGFTDSFGPGFRDAYLIKTDSLGDTLWTKTHGGLAYDDAYAVQETSDGGFILTGSKTGSSGAADVYLLRTNSSGDALWTRMFGGVVYDRGNSVQETQDGGYIIAGQTFSFGSGQGEVYLIKTDGDGLMGIEESNNEYRTRNIDFRLFNNKPNPFSKLTAIRYQIPQTPFNKGGSRGISVSLKIYDISGRLIEILVDERQNPGVYKIEWDGRIPESGVRSGIYFYKLNVGTNSPNRAGYSPIFSETKKMILLR